MKNFTGNDTYQLPPLSVTPPTQPGGGTLPLATTTTVGVVKVGAGLGVTADGTLSASGLAAQNSLAPASDTKAPTVDAVNGGLATKAPTASPTFTGNVNVNGGALDVTEYGNTSAFQVLSIYGSMRFQRKATGNILFYLTDAYNGSMVDFQIEKPGGGLTLVTPDNTKTLKLTTNNNQQLLANGVPVGGGTGTPVQNSLTPASTTAAPSVDATVAGINAKVQNSLAASTTVAPSATAVQTALDLKQTKPTTNQTFFGANAGGTGNVYQGGDGLTFIGSGAGNHNTTNNQTMVGVYAGFNTTTGPNNTFIGCYAGQNNTTGQNNAVFGHFSGRLMSTGSNNLFIGSLAGQSTSGSNNCFMGYNAGGANLTGSNHTALGYQSGPATGALDNTISIGAGAQATTSNTLFVTDTVNVGVGVQAPTSKLQVNGMVHAMSGGIKFPDGTVQLTASTGGGTGTGPVVQDALTPGSAVNAPSVDAVNGGLEALSFALNGKLSTAAGAVGPANLATNAVTLPKLGQDVADWIDSKVSTVNMTLSGQNLTLQTDGTSQTVTLPGGVAGGGYVGSIAYARDYSSTTSAGVSSGGTTVISIAYTNNTAAMVGVRINGVTHAGSDGDFYSAIVRGTGALVSDFSRSISSGYLQNVNLIAVDEIAAGATATYSLYLRQTYGSPTYRPTGSFISVEGIGAIPANYVAPSGPSVPPDPTGPNKA